MAQIHGKQTGIKWNALDVSAAFDSASLDRLMELVETTYFGAGSIQRIAGFSDAKIQLDGAYDTIMESTGGMETDFAAGTAREVKLQMDKTGAASATNPRYKFTALISSIKHKSGVKSRWDCSVTIEISTGAVTRETSGAW
jgi:hypothetical protein